MDSSYPKPDASRKATASAPPSVLKLDINAKSVKDNGDNHFTIELWARPLNPQETQLLNSLFPHTEKGVARLLAQEALFGAMEDGETYQRR